MNDNLKEQSYSAIYKATIRTCTFPRSRLKISWKHWKLDIKLVSTVCNEVINSTAAAFFALSTAFFNTAEGCFGRVSFNILFKSVLFVISASLDSDSEIRLEVLGEKIWTASWSGPIFEPSMLTSPIMALTLAIPLMQTFYEQNNKLASHIYMYTEHTIQ